MKNKTKKVFQKCLMGCGIIFGLFIIIPTLLMVIFTEPEDPVIKEQKRANLRKANLKKMEAEYQRQQRIRKENWDKKLAEKKGPGPKPYYGSSGKCPIVEVYLQQIMNDPDSFKFIGSGPPVKFPDAWIVSYKFSGKNASGIRLRFLYTFVIQKGVVISHHEIQTNK